ncbi:MAG: endonuclease MutS2 [Lachnospiraceae bacterium]|nr:endonuclease MutS2 [Lachnospiraceae bacterium]
MNEKALKTLEFNKIIDQLVTHASSDPGRKKCASLKPMTDINKVLKMQQETEDAVSRVFRKGSTSFGSNKDLGGAVKSLAIGGALPAGILLQIASLLENVARVKAYGRYESKGAVNDVFGRSANAENAGANGKNQAASGLSEEEKTSEFGNDSLSEYFDLLEPLTPLSTEIRRCILAEDEIADDASAGLLKVRKELSHSGEKIHAALMNLINGSARTYLQDPVITLRNDRYCIPVKAEYKGMVKGMIHDQSATGSTLFIEPAAVVELNNHIRELELQEKQEIEKILQELSTKAAEFCPQLQSNMTIMSELDFIFARAGLALEQNAIKPTFRNDRKIDLMKARHPLIPKDKVVPISVNLGKDFDLLVVTGPNTGGKTVSLKTVGLLTLMGQAGLHIPAGDGSELSFFHDVYADIGDEQSIEQSLSTFSSHMVTIVEILKQADSHSLCLFDELGAGTDPTEGAALAIAVLDHLHKQGIRTMASTHYSELKVYALSTAGVENACCEFDVESLRPTYRLLIGIPGKSNAFAISKRLGLSDEIIDAAKEQISQENTRFEDMIADLEKSRVTIEKEQLEISAYKEEIENLKKQLESRQEKLEQNKDAILREANEEARQILQEAKDMADETIRAFQDAGSSSIQELEKSRQKVREKIKEKNSKLSTPVQTTHGNVKAGELRLGDAVKILSMGLKGTVSSLPDAKGNLFVQCGIMRSQANIKDIVLLQEDTFTIQGVGKTTRSSGKKVSAGKSFSISPEINLLGLTVDEAVMELDKYMDDAYLAHLSSVRIVHGKGTGALRSAVQQYLRRNKHVESFRQGAFGEGDAGVTIAEFKK